MGEKPILEFMMPKNSRKTVKFSCEQEDGGEGERGTQVAEIWLIKK